MLKNRVQLKRISWATYILIPKFPLSYVTSTDVTYVCFDMHMYKPAAIYPFAGIVFLAKSICFRNLFAPHIFQGPHTGEGRYAGRAVTCVCFHMSMYKLAAMYPFGDMFFSCKRYMFSQYLCIRVIVTITRQLPSQDAGVPFFTYTLGSGDCALAA